MTNISMFRSLCEEASEYEFNLSYGFFLDADAKIRIWISKVHLFAKNHLAVNEFKKEICDACFHSRTVGIRETFEILISYLRALSEYTPTHEETKNNLTSQDYLTNANSKYDVFISHANKDKVEYVDALRTEINKLGINIFYDTDVLSWGDNWKKKILDGTAQSEFAIIVISKNFFGREWTERELKEFLERQNSSGQKIILPLLHDVTFEELAEQYPSLTEIQCLKTSDCSKEQICILFAKELIKRLKGN